MLRVFPVAGRPSFSDDFGAARGARSHEGIDVFAAEGTPVHAVDDGRVRFDENKLGGHTAYLASNDGTTVYYYAHLASYEGTARPVKAGDVIGYVGRTGNAATTPPHLHFQIRTGGAQVNPYEQLAAVAPPGATNAPRPPWTSPGGAPGGSAKAGGGGLALLLVLYALSKR